MSRQEEQKAEHESRSSQDSYEGTSARTRPYSYNEIMCNRKKKKLSQDDKDAPADTVEYGNPKSDTVEADKFDRRNKDSSHGGRKKKPEKNLINSSKKNKVTSTVKVETVIIAKDGAAFVESGVKSEVVKGTMDDEQSHKKTMENEQPCDTSDNHIGQSHSKYSPSKGRNRDHKAVKSDKEGKRKERNVSDRDPRIIDDYPKGTSERKILNYSETKDRYRSGNTEKKDKENKISYGEEHSNKRSHKGTVNRHDVVSKDPVSLNTRDKRYSPQRLHEQIRRKRRRSVSREHKRDRDTKPSSPEAQRHTSYHRKDHDSSSSQFRKDRSVRNPSDFDRNRKLGNGSSSRHKGHSESGDRLGGYSPRKRKTEDAVKTPSPTNDVSGKKRPGWDVPHANDGNNISSAVLPLAVSRSITSKVHESDGVMPVSSTNLKPQPGNINAQLPIANVSIDAVQLTQSTRPMRRLYVENLPSSVSEKYVVDCLNNLLLSSGANYIQGTEPCISCAMHKEKGQALVEFLTPEDASAALSFDGFILLGSDLKIRRPKDFVAAETAAPEKSVPSANAVNDIVEDSPHKIFIGGISKSLSPKMLMEVAIAFGPLKAYKFMFNDDLDEPRAFLQYVDQSITTKACAGLNGMKLGGKRLIVVPATAGESPSEGDRAPLYGIPDIAKPLLANPTKVLVLKNVFDPECFLSLSQQEIEEIQEDVRLECSRFGTVKSVNVVRGTSISVTSSELVKGDTAQLAPSEGVSEDKDSRSVNTEVERSSRIAEVELESNMKPESLDVEIPIDGVVEDRNNDDHTDKLGEYNCAPTIVTLELETDTADNLPCQMHVTKGTRNPDTGDNEVGDPHLEGNINTGDLNSDGTKEQSLNVSAELCCSPIINVEVTGKSESMRDLEELSSVLQPGNICVEYRRPEATCMASRCFHGRTFDNRIVSVEYISLDLYRRKFPQ